MRRVALATYSLAPGLAPDDQALVPALARLGIAGVPAVWSDPSPDWKAFDAIVIRSCWDYHRRFGGFLAWLDHLDATGRPVCNDTRTVRWNANKHYLVDLAARGVETIETHVVPRGDVARIDALVAAAGWQRFVLKPAVSASGFETFLLESPLSVAGRETVARVAAVGDTLVQPFAVEVPRDGEFSFTFIDGALSHATLKRARRGEFRVQTDHGGSVEGIDAPAHLEKGAARVLDTLDETPLYARVDGIDRDGVFVLMELELIEPNLFLGFREGSADRLARAIAARIAT